jgi:hypothetical protein
LSAKLRKSMEISMTSSAESGRSSPSQKSSSRRRRAESGKEGVEDQAQGKEQICLTGLVFAEHDCMLSQLHIQGFEVAEILNDGSADPHIYARPSLHHWPCQCPVPGRMNSASDEQRVQNVRHLALFALPIIAEAIERFPHNGLD